jgi:flagellar assembly protein FliH
MHAAKPFPIGGCQLPEIASYEAFDYPESGAPHPFPTLSPWYFADDQPQPSRQRPVSAPSTDFEQRLVEETARAFDNGRARGIEEGRRAEREAQAEALAEAEEDRIRSVADLARNFDREREVYFHSVEQEVVKLALAVAARILRREAQSDPLLLVGAVRVALGALGAATEIKVHVPPADLDLWTEAIALVPSRGAKPVVVAGEGMRLGECRLETSLGGVDLGIPSQLSEIERHLLESRPAHPAEPDVRPASSFLPEERP